MHPLQFTARSHFITNKMSGSTATQIDFVSSPFHRTLRQFVFNEWQPFGSRDVGTLIDQFWSNHF